MASQAVSEALRRKEDGRCVRRRTALDEEDGVACLGRQLNRAGHPVHVPSLFRLLAVASGLGLLAAPEDLWVASVVVLERVVQVALVAARHHGGVAAVLRAVVWRSTASVSSVFWAVTLQSS